MKAAYLLFTLLAILLLAMIAHIYKKPIPWDKLPFPEPVYSEPTIIERTTP